ncbi:MAG: YciI family protein [Proteobacteria bacterium]|nr:YciI family protein [Pseudomonadota bacterium]
MFYALLAYHDEDQVIAMSRAEDVAKMDRMNQVHGRLIAERRLGPAARLGATALARTVRDRGVVLDGPFAETKEHLLGFYILDCADEAEALAAVDALKAVNPEAVYELRPIALYLPGTSLPMSDFGLGVVRP